MDQLSAARVIRAIEDSFPIVEINRLAVPERNSFKPIYQMHKWFARRASCVFRAILLGCLKPLPLGADGKPVKTGAQVIMEEFYRDHVQDPDTNDKVILDPFMGGGTTVVEALRLGCRVVGIDLNPVAWFIVKTEVEPVNLDDLRLAFQRLEERKVDWSEKSVKETLLSQYRTECPCCGTGEAKADIIYTLWVKSAICTGCKKQVPLFKDYIVSQKSPSIRFLRDVECPRCHKRFDWEIEPAALVAEPSLQINSSTYSAGAGRSTARWAYSAEETVRCPWCEQQVEARPLTKATPERKKVSLAVLLCPHCESVWQWRGEIPDAVACPVCKKQYNPLVGNVPNKGKFLCSCGHTDDIIRSIRRLPDDALLPMHPYAIEGYCAICAGTTEHDDDEDEEDETENDLFGRPVERSKTDSKVDHPCRLTKNHGKFFKRITPADLRKIEESTRTWEREISRLPYPKQAIPEGYNTNQMIKHHYRYWHQMFHPRQLLCLATLLEGIQQEQDQTLKEMLLSSFILTLNNNNQFSRFHRFTFREGKVEGIFSRHDFQPKSTWCEANCWGAGAVGYGSFSQSSEKILAGKIFAENPYDLQDKAKQFVDPVTGTAVLECRSSLTGEFGKEVICIVTDPPYAGNVNYSELSDFFYVWLRLALLSQYPCFAPDHTPKVEEIIENPTRGITARDFEVGLRTVFANCLASFPDQGLLVFTFHHAEGSAWESLLRAVIEAGFEIDGVYPIHGEAETSLHLMEKEAISYDLIHVCKKRDLQVSREPRSWAGIRQEIRRRAKKEVVAIESGRYGNEPLSPSDVNIILIGKCLELYSRHYGAVVDHEDAPVPLSEALKQIRDIADQMTELERPLPSELEDIDPESRVYFRALCAVKEVKSDDVHKATRGILEPADLIEAGLMTRMRAGRGRSYEVKQPAQRLSDLMERFRNGSGLPQANLFGEVELPTGKKPVLFIDRVHLLLGLIDAGESIVPWLDRFRGETPQIRAALEYLESRNKTLAPACQKILALLDVGSLFKGVT